MTPKKAGDAGPKLVKMSILARLSETPAATLKHYLREGLLDAAVRTSRNMALYDVGLVPRIRKIKELQRTRFLPLGVIKQVLDSPAGLPDDATVAAAIGRVLEREGRTERRTRAELVERGFPASDLDWLEGHGLITARGERGHAWYGGDDLELLRTLGAARRAGLGPEMLQFSVIEAYVNALRELVRAELRIFRASVVPHAGARLPALAEAAATLSERVVVLLRRKILLPTLHQLVAEETERAGKARRREPPRSPSRKRGRGARSGA